MITFTPKASCTLIDACAEAALSASLNREAVRFEWGGIVCMAEPKEKGWEVEKRWQQNSRKSKAANQSPIPNRQPYAG